MRKLYKQAVEEVETGFKDRQDLVIAQWANGAVTQKYFKKASITELETALFTHEDPVYYPEIGYFIDKVIKADAIMPEETREALSVDFSECSPDLFVASADPPESSLFNI